MVEEVVAMLAAPPLGREVSKLMGLGDTRRMSKEEKQARQEEQKDAVEKFRNKVTSVLVATDLVSRGFDVPRVDMVIRALCSYHCSCMQVQLLACTFPYSCIVRAHT